MLYRALLLLSVVFIWSVPHSIAQTNSVLGRFSVDFNRGCSGVTINITENGTFDNPQYWFQGFDDGVAGSTNLFNTYPDPGEFYITQVINDVLPGGQMDSVLITIVEPEIPDFIIRNCDNHQVRVEITEDYYDSYRVEFTDTESQIVQPLSLSEVFNYGVQGNYRIDVTGLLEGGADNCGTDNAAINTVEEIIDPVLNSIETVVSSSIGDLRIVHTLGDDIIYNLLYEENGSSALEFERNVEGTTTDIAGVNTRNDFHCYRIETFDACNNLTIPSETVCSVNFSVREGDGGNLIEWETDSTIVQSYNVLRDAGLLINIDNAGQTSFLDTAVVCNLQSIYNVQPIFGAGSSLGLDTAVISSQSGALPAIEDLPISTIDIDEVLLRWSVPDTGIIPFNKYFIEKNINGRGWRTDGSASDTTYVDDDATFVGTHSYRILYSDDCDNLSAPSPTTTPIIMQQENVQGRRVTYSWNRYETWLQGIRGYTLEKVDTSGTVLEEFSVLSGREWEITFGPDDLTDKYIRVRAESLDENARFTYSNAVLTSLRPKMYLPTAFTPDGDNLNDRLIARGPAVSNFKMEIYNRWGTLIFVTNNSLSGWDGEINGEEQPEGTYIYKIFFEDGEGRKYDQTGAFSLMRKQ